MTTIAEEGLIAYYSNLFENHGLSPKSLGWTKGNQFVRYQQLTANLNLKDKSFLDVGCGFGDFISYLHHLGVENFKYTGIDIFEEFLIEGAKIHSGNNIEFIKGNFLTTKFKKKYDYVIASGTFNHRIEGCDQYEYLRQFLTKMFSHADKAISADLLSNKVDYSHEHNFNYCPSRVVEIGYSLSNRILLSNIYFPFEFSLTVFKDCRIEKQKSIFANL